tara:strand:+ start:55 stop:657 length:603 start_codon:yes stop_codon:yes gene_type:complete
MTKLYSQHRIIIATNNSGKLKEFSDLLENFPVVVESQPKGLKIEETGNTFADNARLKAITVANLTGEWSLSDDSGLSVDALNGAPGVYSARYGNNDSERINRLLNQLGSENNRRAKFFASLCLAAPNNKILIEAEGFTEGLITYSPRGKNGFGYDPIFEVISNGKTYAEMSNSLKRKISHRGQAFSLLEPELRKLIESFS